MSFSVVIPARRGSTRLPDKVIRQIAGRPMIAHVCHQAQQSQAHRVVVATDDQVVMQAAEQVGVEAVLTQSEHTCGTERLAEVVQKYCWDDDEIVVNVQGDEPLMPPQLINQVAQALIDHPKAGIATAVTPILERSEFNNPNVVKAVVNSQGQAIYFSRAAIPYHRDSQNQNLEHGVMRHLGIYAYRVRTLKRFVAATHSDLEVIESLEQLRAFDLNIPIQVVKATHTPGPGVDTEQDLARVEAIILQAGQEN